MRWIECWQVRGSQLCLKSSTSCAECCLERREKQLALSCTVQSTAHVELFLGGGEGVLVSWHRARAGIERHDQSFLGTDPTS